MQKYSNSVQDLKGNALVGAVITVTDSLAAIATIYSDDGITSKGNPFAVDAEGEYSFFAANGEYTIAITYPGVATQTYTNVRLFDPTDAGAVDSANVSHTPAGTGAVATTVKNYLNLKVTVKSFGAVGDGIADDTNSIQAAINYIELHTSDNISNGPYLGPQTLYFEEGYFKITSPIVIRKSISLVGLKSAEYSSGARLVSTTSGDLLRCSPTVGGVSFSIERLTFLSLVPGTGHLINIVDATPGYNSFSISNCVFSNPQNASIRVTGNDVKILHNTFDVSGFSGNCIQLGSNTVGDTASDVRIHGNDFFNIVVYCIQIFNAYDVSILGNIVAQPDSLSRTLAFVDAIDSSPTMSNAISLVGNKLYGCKRIFGCDTSTNVVISGNTAWNCGIGASETYDAFYFSGVCSAIAITGNTIAGNYGPKSIFYNNGTLSNVTIAGNSIPAIGTGTALICGGMTGSVSANSISGYPTNISATDLYKLGNYTYKTQAPTFGASIDIDAANGEYVIIIATSNINFAVNAPINGSDGQKITVKIYNNSGVALGTVTWNAIFKMAAWTQPGVGSSRSITFSYSSGLSKWSEISRTASDIPI